MPARISVNRVELTLIRSQISLISLELSLISRRLTLNRDRLTLNRDRLTLNRDRLMLISARLSLNSPEISVPGIGDSLFETEPTAGSRSPEKGACTACPEREAAAEARSGEFPSTHLLVVVVVFL